ncbi:hypothetical protein D3C72_2482800 [compost metagenome]
MGSDFAKRITDASDKQVTDAKAAPVGTLPKDDVKKIADDILAWIKIAEKPSMGGGHKFNQHDYDGLKKRAEDLHTAAS